jgi:hypothetical protein
LVGIEGETEIRGKMANRNIKEYEKRMKQDRQCTYKVTLKRVGATIIRVEKQCSVLLFCESALK